MSCHIAQLLGEGLISPVRGVFIDFTHCLSEVRTSLGIRYEKDIRTTSDISSWKIGVVNEISLMECIMRCMMAETCFWATLNNGTCELLSISRTEINNLSLTFNDRGLPTYQMIRVLLLLACRLLDGCFCLDDESYCIKYYVDGLEYAYARNICKRDGGELLRIDSQSKQDLMVRILTFTLPLRLKMTVQGTKDDAGNWMFDDGKPMTYFNWNTGGGQPNNCCAERNIYINSIYDWKWHDIGPDARPFLCEIPA
ncbi:Hypothetical predicted protein [Mytilus galloprovincialis]|uniref:C-type lectin domain-containing protein n=1 Tax=Mytilus galloprovincialis TaxID=29158 RepID=A0A8B6FAD7_MYTGA|nr:Hypothetical predicted protein [Mytilus galloprovincialis]